ncbi:MAG TPA: DHH family phosphoesterase [Desulfomonilaceae bacterium]|nr:DHH family phosphoesterase [Desulfomonilaceae bacterium]
MTKVAPYGNTLSSSLKWDVSKSVCKLDMLAEVLKGSGKRRILILCHNNPDPDTIGSASGLQFLLTRKFGVKSVIGYGGVVTRAENKAMVQRLGIKMTQLMRVDPSRYHGIALIDAQPGTGNNLIAPKSPPPMIVIDHHPLRKASLKSEFYDIRTKYGATSTIIAEYLTAAGLRPTRRVANALLYGIKADTHSLMRGSCKIDFTVFNYLSPFTNPRVLGGIERPALKLEYLEDYLKGLSRTVLYRDVAVADIGRIHSEAIVPELADLLLRLEDVYWSLCIGRRKDLLIISLRSTSRKHQAGVVIQRIIGRAGSAGGHKEMAGGQISVAGMTEEEVQALTQKLTKKLLKILEREGAHARSISNAPGR